MYFVINSFNPQIKAGEEEDIYYTLEIKEYRPYGVKTVNVDLSGLASARARASSTVAKSTAKNTVTASKAANSIKTYTVVRGDCLWNITKRYTGNGARWRELYNINKGIIGGNPNLIRPGQVLTLPSGW